MGKLLVSFVIIAAVATGIAFALTYWYIFVGLGLAGFGIYAFVQKQKDAGNKV